MLTVCLPGTGGMLPLPERFLACCWAEHQGAGVLIDCGEGTQVALRKAGVKTARIALLLITHTHADHISGLPGFLLTLGGQGRTETLTIAGPSGLARAVRALLTIAPEIPFPVNVVELADGGEIAGAMESLSVRALALDHRTPCLAYRLTLTRKPVFNPEKAAALGVPPPLFKVLHRGEAVTLPGGRVIEPDQVIDGLRAPISFGYMTDTRPVPAAANFMRGVDLLVCEGMYSENEMLQKMREKKHMLFSEAATIARDAGAKRLALTHFSPAVPDPAAGIGAARAIFPGAVAGADGMTIEL